jgi:hypothetical protein
MKEKLDALAYIVKLERQAKISESSPVLGPSYINVRLIRGPKYTKLDIQHGGQWSGALMIDADGNIFGIKAYGVIHRGHPYGTLDTILNWYWGNYYPMPRPASMPRPTIETGETYTASENPTHHPLQVANILVGSWGYDQTNIDFYQVVSRTDKTVTFCEMNQIEIETGFMCGTCTPISGSYKTPQTHTRRVDVDEHGKASVSFAKDGEGHRVTLHLWDGKPQHWSSYA